MTPYFQTDLGKLYHGDCLEVMKEILNNSISAILTDPPYGLKFMGKSWDHGVPGVPFWTEALRISKPGAHLLAFGGTRTHHRLMCAIEDAGWEIRDTLGWIYGSGFPKSLDVSKAIDKEEGAKRPIVGKAMMHTPTRNGCFDDDAYDWGEKYQPVTAPATPAACLWSGYGTALKPAWEPVILARKPLDGTVAQNVQKWGCGALNVDGCRIEGKAWKRDTPWRDNIKGGNLVKGQVKREPCDPRHSHQLGRFPANLILDEEAAALLDEQSGVLTSGNNPSKRSADKHRAVYAGWKGEQCLVRRPTNSGYASRFFYCAKASRSERGKGNNHPTVKPRALIRYLLKLISAPTGGIVLDMFAGSGTVPLECERAGRKWIAIEKEKASCEIIKKRIETFEWGETEPGQERLFPMTQEALL